MTDNCLQRGRVILTLSVSCCLFAMSVIPVQGGVFEKLSENLSVSENEWHIYVVDEGIQSSIDIDSSYLPHISYRKYPEYVLSYATWDQGSWSLQTIDNRSGSGWISSLILDSRDIPMIAHWNAHPHPDSSALKMAYWGGGNWTFDVVDPITSVWPSIALDMDSKELPRICYLKWATDKDLWLAELNFNGTWDYEIVDSRGDIRSPSLFVDSEDHTHISYEDMALNELRYAHWNGTSWSIQRIDGDDPSGMWSLGGWSSIKVDRYGNPHISYKGGRAGTLKYATRVLGKWQNTTIDTMIGPGTSLDLDSLGNPHIGYEGGDASLRHAWWNGSSWQIEIVDENGSAWVGDFPSMRIDGRDEIHITYLQWDPVSREGYTKYATTSELPTSEIETSVDIDPNTLNLKSKGKFITAYIELEGADVRDINASSILLNGAISPILDEKYGFVTSEDSYIVDHDNDGIMERMVKFDRAEVERILTPSDEVVLRISGSLYDGAEFEGSDTIRVINP